MTYRIPIWGLVLSCVSLAALAQESPLVYRAWTNTSGRRAELAFVAVVDGKLKMQSRAGQEFLLPLEQFNEADQKFFCDQQINKLSGPSHSTCPARPTKPWRC